MKAQMILGKKNQIITKELYTIVMKHKVKLNNILDYSRDYNIDYFGFKTLEKSYLLKVNGDIVERPQHMFLRVSLGIYGNDIRSAIECYNALSMKKCIHATPTLFNSGTLNGQLASCFLMGINEDSIASIYDSLKDCALISKCAGGIDSCSQYSSTWFGNWWRYRNVKRHCSYVACI